MRKIFDDNPNISTHGSDAGLVPGWAQVARQKQKAAVSRERDRLRREEAELERRLREIRR